MRRLGAQMVLQIPHLLESGHGDDLPNREASSRSFISTLYSSISKGLPFAEPVPAFRVDESDVVRGILQMLQGFSSSTFHWDGELRRFSVKNGFYMSHLSHCSLYSVLDQFLHAANCLKSVEVLVNDVDSSANAPPTLRAFCACVSMWLKRLRDIALKKEEEVVGAAAEFTITLLSLVNSLSSICSGSDLLLQIVQEAIPNWFFDGTVSIQSNEFAVHILDTLYMKLNEVCLVQGGKDEAYHMILTIFSGTLLPYLEGLDSWLYDGNPDDPYNELFFYADNIVSIDQPEFWEKSYLFRSRKHKSSNAASLSRNCEFNIDDKKATQHRVSGLATVATKGKDHDNSLDIVCPLFLKDVARAIVSAGKSLQLVRHVWGDCILSLHDDSVHMSDSLVKPENSTSSNSNITRNKKAEGEPESPSSLDMEATFSNVNKSSHEWEGEMKRNNFSPCVRMLTLPEVFLISLVGLIEEGELICKHFNDALLSAQEISIMCKSYTQHLKLQGENSETGLQQNYGNWFKYMLSAIVEKGRWSDLQKEFSSTSGIENEDSKSSKINDKDILKEIQGIVDASSNRLLCGGSLKQDEANHYSAFYPQNPVIAVCKGFLDRDDTFLEGLNISCKFSLPPLNDEGLRMAVFSENLMDVNRGSEISSLVGMPPMLNGTDFNLGFRSCQLEHARQRFLIESLESMYPYPTVLPYFQENLCVSDLVPFQRNSTLASGILKRLNAITPKHTPLPTVLMQKCLIVYIRKQVDFIGKHILLKFMGDWKLMEELGILRSIYLLGSGDLLQEFLISIFNKLDKGDTWDDDFELNTLLQQSIRNSADEAAFRAPDSLVVSIVKHNVSESEDHGGGINLTPRKTRDAAFGIDSLDLLRFTYKVSWPLDLIINSNAINKYNQVMAFLLKVKRAKFVLDKARKWMWKCRGNLTGTRKHHLLVEQKLLHFVDAFHQYVMDRVFHSAWLELCNGMATAGSLDEVIQVHEAYLVSIQRQCFVAPDKLWALIASRVKIILGLALDFYSIQQTLASGGAAPAIKARCEMEVDRVEKQFDDCIAFLIRILSFKINVGHFPHLADLVTRINYNYFYMSENGNLLTTPCFELAGSRLSQGRQI